MLRRASLLASTCCLVFAMTADVGGAPITNGFGLSAPGVTVVFDEPGFTFPADTLINSQYATFGVTFSGLRYDSGPSPLPGISGPHLRNYYNLPGSGEVAGLVNPFSIYFSAPQSAAAFGLATNPSTTTFRALLSGTEVEAFSTSTSFDDSSRAFFGFSGILFDEIQVDVSTDFALIDNVQFEAVPEPGTLLLVGGGLLGLIARRRLAR